VFARHRTTAILGLYTSDEATILIDLLR